MKRLQDKACVITGAGSGIGRASAIRFAAEGARVLVVGRSAANIEETVELVRAAGGRAEALVADATAEAEVAAVVARCIVAFRAIDVFYANAGSPGSNASVFEQSVDEWNEVWRDNVLSSLLAVKHAGRAMVEAGKGSIILTSSAASLRANAGAIGSSAYQRLDGVSQRAPAAFASAYSSGGTNK